MNSLDSLDEEILEVERLLGLSTRQLVRTRLVLLLSDLQQEKRRRDLALASFQAAVTGALPVFRNVQRPGEAMGLGQVDPLRQPFPGVLSSQGSLGNPLVDGLQNMQGNTGGVYMQQGHASPGGLLPPGPLGNALSSPWPFSFGAEGAMAGSTDGYRVLTTCSWEQSDTMVKVYVPLRGVQTDMLRTTFTPTSVEVKVHDLHGKNYIFTLSPTFQPIAEDGCMVVASKTRKNILITMQKLQSFTQDERHWRDLYGDRSQLTMLA
ncbi:probable calcyclin-binding protein at C-terminar half [Coccomyxa sp. Obi]|nr:probable calcyclin-binding protein at C-terminar half [Coccomyxa sp. Obi]